MIGHFTLNPTSINRLMRSEERISPFGLMNCECGAIRLLRQEDLFFRLQKTLLAPSTAADAQLRQAQ